MAINLPPTAFNKFNEAIKLFEKTATLVYPEKKEQCANCVTNTFGGRSSNFYKTGGPLPFDRGSICPLCNGSGFKLLDAKESVQLRIYHRKRDWIDVGIQVDVPNNVIQTVGYMSDYAKLTKAKELLVDIGGHNQVRYKRLAEPFVQGFKQNPVQYVVIFWETV
jgi:hypothetical protein